MKVLKFRYPNDPPCNVLVMSLSEFLASFPRTPTTITAIPPGGGEIDITRIHHASDYVVCDLCNAPINDVVHVKGSKAYCVDCTKRFLSPWLKP